MALEHYRSHAELRPRLGLVVPSWFPPDHAFDDAVAILRTNLADLDNLFEPDAALVVIDGSGVAQAAAKAVSADQGGFSVRVLEGEPQGKGGAVAAGLAELLENPLLDWFLIRDHDADHFLADVPRLVRLGLQVSEAAGPGPLVVTGARSEPGRPMGWVRAEWEAMVNTVVWRGLHYFLAQFGQALDERFLALRHPIPDLQSGFKCYNRAGARVLVEATSVADWPTRRWGCEVLSTVEIIAAGGAYAEVERLTLDEQPLTTYEGTATRPKLHGDILCWTANRLGLPAPAVLGWLDSAIAHHDLRTTAEGLAEILALRRYVGERLAPGTGLGEEPPVVPWFC